MAIAHSTHVITEATITPVDRPNQLRRWWRPEMPGYKAYKVKVLGRRKSGKRDLLKFEFAGDAALKEKEPLQFEVDLNVSDLVWPVLPSTAPQAQSGQYGFLLLSAAWAGGEAGAAARGADLTVYSENGGKFPIIGGVD